MLPTLAGNLRDDGRRGNSLDIVWTIVLKMSKNQVDLGIEQFVLGNNRVDDVVTTWRAVIRYEKLLYK